MTPDKGAHGPTSQSKANRVVANPPAGRKNLTRAVRYVQCRVKRFAAGGRLNITLYYPTLQKMTTRVAIS